jgi:phytoene dehydrogenase-like protein
MPLHGLHLCSAGTHPSGEIMGAPGYDGAHTLLDECVKAKQ